VQLAVQAATSSARHSSFQALLNLQQQLQEVYKSTDASFRSRLSRVVVKLFARVVKAEESVDDPYVQGRIDMEALICSFEDILVSHENSLTNASESAQTSIEMISSLLRSIITVHESTAPIRSMMEGLEIDPDTSELGKLLAKCDNEEVTTAAIDADIVTESASRTTLTKMTPSKDVASLVSRLGCAPPGEEREAALESIRSYKLHYGGIELDTHLQQLSGPFREFIMEQINRDTSPQKQVNTVRDNTSSGSGSVSDRIRSLRSRLQASDGGSPQKTFENETTQQTPDRSIIPPSNSKTTNLVPPAANVSPSINKNGIVAPSPSKIPSLKVTAASSTTSSDDNNNPSLSLTVPESKLPTFGTSRLLQSYQSSALSSATGVSSSAQTLRERLAARQGATSNNVATIAMSTTQASQSSMSTETIVDVSTTSVLSSSTSTSLGRAAALRARLEMVKQQQQQSK
jgi:hypothetical protein